ncbi:MAG TPA: ParB N-terminal domain-containing protein [Candidatus Methylomirabilis sp.]|nr:ParB N-terminal domain-containing protein [Candidatus Methylomirabilis sp.]
MKTKLITVPIAELKMDLFVRKGLDQDHTLHLAELIEHGVRLEPITVTPDLMVIDGRHRIEAHELNKRNEIEATVVTGLSDEADLISAAYKANLGGSLPPSPQDTEHAVMLLIERGVAKRRIADLLGLPAGLGRKYVDDVQSKIARNKVRRAVTAVTEEGHTVAKAAEAFGVDPEKLKETLQGVKRRGKQNVAEIQRRITWNFKSLSSKNASLLRSLLDKLEDGDVTDEQVNAIFEHIESLQKRAIRAIKDWKQRYRVTKGAGASVQAS